MDTILPVKIAYSAIRGTIYEPSHEGTGLFEVFGKIRVVKVRPEQFLISSAGTTTCSTPWPITLTMKNMMAGAKRLSEYLIAQLSSGITTKTQPVSRLTAEFPEHRSEPEEMSQSAEKEEIDNLCPMMSWSEDALKIMAIRSKDRSASRMYGSYKMRNLYTDPSSLLRIHLAKYEHWYSQQNTEAIKSHITERTRIDKYDGSEYSILWGEKELKTRCWIKEGEIIAHYAGQLLTEEEFERRCSTNCQLDFAPEDYAVDVQGTKLVLDGSHGNQMHYINDGTLKDDHGNKHDKRNNVELLTLFKETETKLGTVRVPRIYIVANQDILPDERIWLRYGQEFWKLRQEAPKIRQPQTKRRSTLINDKPFKYSKQIKVDSTISEILNASPKESKRKSVTSDSLNPQRKKIKY